MLIYEKDSEKVKAAKLKVVEAEWGLTKAKADLEIAKNELIIAKLNEKTNNNSDNT